MWFVNHSDQGRTVVLDSRNPPPRCLKYVGYLQMRAPRGVKAPPFDRDIRSRVQVEGYLQPSVLPVLSGV